MGKFLGVLVLSFISTVAVAKDVEKLYKKACAVCHVAGVAGAPKIGDDVAWAPRLTQGMDVLVASVVNGKGAMPPKGLCGECSKDDYKALIKYMSGK